MNVLQGMIQPDAVGPTLVTIGAALMGAGTVQAAGLHQDVWSDPWFDAGCAVGAPGALLAILAIISWWRAWRPRQIPAPAIGGQVPDSGLPDASPLLLRLGKGEWHLFDDTLWAFGIPVRVTNVTEEPITLAHYSLLSGSDESPHPPLTQEAQGAARSWMARLSSDHESELFEGEVIVPPGASVTRWFVNSTYASLPNGGRPALTLQIKDILNNTYVLGIPGYPAKTYRSS